MSEPTEAEAPPVMDPGFLERAFDANTKAHSDQSAMRGGSLFAHQTATIMMQSAWCDPSLDTDFELTLKELAPSDEVDAAKSADAGGGATLGFEMAKRSMYQVNGSPVGSVKRNWLWSAIGMKGRQAVALAFTEHFSVGSEEVELAMGNVRIGTT